MRFIDPTLIVLTLSVIAGLVLLVAMLRIRRLRIGNISETSFFLLLGYVSVSLGWVAAQMLQRLQTLNLITGFDTYALARIGLYILFALAVIFFQLTRVVQRRVGPGLGWWIAGAAWLLLCAVLYENPFPPAARIPETFFPVGRYFIIRTLLAYDLLVGGWALLMGYAVLMTIRNYRQTTNPLHRNRILYWSMAIFLAVTGEILYLVLLPHAGNLLHMLAVASAVYVMLTHNLPDLRLAGRRSLSYLIMLLLTVAVYTGGFYVIQLIFARTPGYNPLFAGAILALALAALFNPLLGIVRRFVSRLISGARYDPRQTLSEYSMSISNILDMEVLASVVVGLISEAMEISHGALITVHRETSAPPDDLPAENLEAWRRVFISLDQPPVEDEVYVLRTVSGLGQVMPEGRLTGKNPAVYSLRREHHPLTQYDIDLQPRFQLMEPEERTWLSSLNMDVYVPIYAKDTWIGMLALGPKISGDRYFDEDLGLLQTLADQTAVALENARLYQDLKLRNADNERLNAELKSANNELARLDQAKSDFINIASHELRTPLTQVLGYNDILGEMIKADDLQPAVGIQMVDSVRRAARRLEEIVETMFDVSKLDTKTLDLVLAPTSLSSIVTIAIDTWSKGLQERKQTVTVRGLANLPSIVADGKRMTQVFSHLVQNAIKSTPDCGQIYITGRVVTQDTAPTVPTPSTANLENILAAVPVSGTLAGAAEHYVEVVVADTGIGIAAEDLERIFEKFYRVGNVLLHSTGDTKFKGAGPGLGLTIARGIVEAHGGRIWAESPGYNEETCPGAKFHVLLPIHSSVPQMPKKI